jgi:phosphoribosyl-ATP pyrophosphohydrolase
MSEIKTLHEAITGIILGLPGASRAPRTRRLVSEGRSKMAKKVGEEGVEVALAGESGNKKHTIEESADLIYNMVALWANMNITPAEVWAEMARRRTSMGIAEKLPKLNKITGLPKVGILPKPHETTKTKVKTKPRKTNKKTKTKKPLVTDTVIPVEDSRPIQIPPN